MIMGHSESKYQRLEPKKEKFKKKSSDPLFNVQKQQVQGFLVQRLGAISPNDKTSIPPNLRRTALQGYPTPHETRVSMGNILWNEVDDTFCFTTMFCAGR